MTIENIDEVLVSYNFNLYFYAFKSKQFIVMNKIEKWFSSKSDFGLLIIRLFIGLRLVYGVFDNIISWDKMLEFSEFLKANGFPLPTFCAVLSVYAQFICAVFILIGYKTRFAAFILALNFLIAIVMVHSNVSIEAMTPALAMLFICIALLFMGSGKYAIDRTKLISQTT